MSDIEFDEGVEEVVETAPEETREAAEEPSEESTGESTEETSDESTAETSDEAVSFTPQQQRFINERIVAKKVAQQKEAERRAEELERKLQEYQEKQPSGAPEVPEMPNVWDDDYEEKVKARDEAIIQRARWEEDQRAKEMREQEEQQQAAARQQEELMGRVVSYTERAKSLGISESELQVAGTAVSQVGMPEDLTMFILDDDKGPAITTYLARNLQEVQKLQSMNPLQAAVYLTTEIKPKVSRSLKRTSPPDPADTVKGSGVPEKERGPKGATFE
jgi:hypothetical protein